MRWEEERLFFEGDEFFADLLREIDKAATSVTLETYIFAADGIGREVEQHLIRAALRGVHVRLLVDGIGASTWIDRRNPELERAGVDIRVYHPLSIATSFSRLLSEIGIGSRRSRQTASGLSRLNRRDHRKLCLIDHQKAWVGSINISADHSRRYSGPSAWRDTAIFVSGSGISEIQRGFEYAWVRAHKIGGKRNWTETLLSIPHRPLRLSPLVRLNHTLNLRRASFRDFSKRVRKAEKKLWLTNAYLSPSKPLMQNLAQAAKRGLDVRVLVPRDSDVFFMPWVARAHYGPLLKAGVRIFEYLPRFLHAKSVIIDDWAAVGTSNMNRRSLLRDFEIDIVLTHEESRAALERQYLEDLKSAAEIHHPGSRLTAWLGRTIGFLLKNWL